MALNFLLLLAAWLGFAEVAFAAVSITPAGGGLNISADKAANATSPAWTTLGALVINEGNKFDFDPGTAVTLVLKAPAGFEFNTAATPNISFLAGRDITAASIAVNNSTTITITVTIPVNDATDQLTIGNSNGIQVRPTAGTPLASGQIYRPTTGGGNASFNGVTSTSNTNGIGGSNFGSLSEAVGAASQLSFTTQPAAATTGASFGIQPVIRSQDQFGNNSTTNLGASRTVSISLSAGTGPLLGNTNLNIGTSGGNGTVTYTNLQIDSAGNNKQLTASATGLTAGLSAVFSVNGRPTISAITNQVTPEDITLGPLAFTIDDEETAANDLTLSRFSTNTALVPVSNIVFGGSGGNRTVTITPADDLFGQSRITLVVSDGIASASNSFLVTVTSANDAPTLNTLTNRTILEEAGLQSVSLSGISAGAANETSQTLTVTASSSDTSLIPHPSVTYTSPNATGSISFTPVTNQFGSATISVVVRDNGGITNGGLDAVTNTFLVTVQPVNDRPTLAALTNRIILEDAGPQNVNLLGITAGPANENSQTLTATAFSSNPTLIPNPTVNYTNPASTGMLIFNAAPNQTGTATITVVVEDDGGTASGGIDAVTNSFTVTINAVNDPPTLNTVTNLTIPENSGLQLVNLSGITPGPTNENGQVVTITASSSNPALIPNPTVNYTNPNVAGTLTFSSVTNGFGSAVISVVVRDNAGTASGGIDALTNSFTVTVLARNDAPTLNGLTNLTILEGAGTQIVPLSGIGPGPTNEVGQVLTVTAFSSVPTLIPNPTVSYISPNTSGSISFAPVANQFGTSIVTVVVRDNGGTNNGGVDAVTNSFTVTVQPMNDPPTLNALTNLVLIEDPGLQTANLSGITIGPANEAPQTLTVTASSSSPGVVPHPTVVYTSPNPTGSLTFTPILNQSGTAVVSVVVRDNGGTNSGGMDAVTNLFTVTVLPANDPPTLNALTNLTLLEDASLQTVNLSGITPGPANESSQTLIVTATSSNPGVVPHPTVNYTAGNATGTLTFTPVSNQFGTATITVVLNDDGGTANSGVDSLTNTFTVTVNAVNDLPALDPINNLVLNVNPGLQTVNLAGINSGPSNESGQTLTITATSSNLSVIPNPTVTYTSPNTTGSLSFTPVTNSSGTATIAVTVRDNGGTSSGGQDTLVRQFTVTVTPTADLQISQTSTPNPAFQGGTMTYTLTVSNRGPTSASGILVTNVLPDGIGAAVTASSSQGTTTNHGPYVVCSLGSLTNQGTATVTIGVQPLSLGAYTNVAQVFSPVADPNAANNTSSLVTTVVPPNFNITTTSLAAESCINGAIDPAENVTVNFSIQNNGVINATNLVATLVVSGGVTVPGTPQNYGALAAGGGTAARAFSFVPIGVCGGSVVATLQLQDGPVSLGAISTMLNLGAQASRITTFTNTNSISIPSFGNANPYPSSLQVSNLSGVIQKVTVTFNNLIHSQPDDLDILLISPQGQRILLMSDAGGINTINNVTLTFDDAAAGLLPDTTQIVSGTYKPTDFQPTDELPAPAPGRPYSTNLASLNGINPNGEWRLYITDDIGSFQGLMSGGWRLAITSMEPTCCVPTSSLDLALNSFPEPNPVVVGNLLTNFLSITNFGPSGATGVTVSNPLPAGAAFISAIPSQGSCTNLGNAFFCNLGNIANNGTASVAIALVPGLTGSLTNLTILSANQPDYAPSNNVTASVVEVVVPSISIISDVAVVEGNTNITFTAELSSLSSQTITINYATSNDTALAGSDYVGTNGLLTFLPGQTSKPILVSILSDPINEATEFLTINLFNPVNVSIGTPSGLCTIVDDDALPSLSINDISVAESHSSTNANFTISLSPASGQSVLVNYATTNGSALAGLDYVVTNGTLEFLPGQTSQIVSVPLIGDTINESNETFFVNLSAQVNANFGKSQGIGTIVNDDFLATLGPAGSTLALENCVPGNGVIDPNEAVTVNFSLRNLSAGTAATTNLVATLQQTGGIITPGSPQNYGALTAGGAAVSRPFTFTANGACGDTLTAVLQLQDGSSNLGTVMFFLTMGQSAAITNAFTNNSFITVQDAEEAAPYPSSIVVSNLNGQVTRVTATLLNLSHSYPADLDVLLVSPSGQGVMLMSDAGNGNPIANVNVTLDDLAGSSLPNSQIISGTYKPTDYEVGESLPSPAPPATYGANLAALNGINPSGTWSLYVSDDTGGDAGNIAGGWRLTLTTLQPANCCGSDSAANLAVGVAGPANVPLGSNITYTINLTNLGPNTASDVLLTNLLPAAVSFVSAVSTVGSCSNDNGTVICTLGTMTNGARATMTLVVNTLLAGTMTNRATAFARTPDPSPANNTGSSVTFIIPPPPVASFTAAPVSGSRPLTVTFSDASTGVTTNRFWNFGDGSTTNTSATNFAYTYNSAGTNTVTLVVSGPGGNSTMLRSDYVQITNIPSLLAVSPDFLSFGSVIVGQTNSQNYQVVNNGGSLLSGSATVALPFRIQSGSPFNIAPGQTSLVQVSFAPTGIAPFNASVVFVSNGGNSTNNVSGQGVTAAQLAVAPANLNFGLVHVNTNVQATFTLTNLGSLPLTNGSATVGSGPFTILSGTPFNLPGFGSTNITVRFSPTNAGTFSNAVIFTTTTAGNSTNPLLGTAAIVPVASFTASPTNADWPLLVTFFDNSTGTITNRFWSFGDGGTTNTTVAGVTHTYPVEGTHTVSLTVSGPLGTNTLTRPNYIVTTNGPPRFALIPSALNFGPVVMGSTESRSFQVVNSDTNTLVGTMSASAPFQITNGAFNIPPGQTGIVFVRFSPTSAGNFSNVVTIASTGGNSTNSVTGIGLTPAQLAVLPASLNLGTVALGSNAQAAFTVTNTGGATLSNGLASVTGPFSIISGSPFSLPGFSSTNVVVRFTPAAAGAFSNAVVFTSGNDGSSTNTVTGVGAVIPVASFSGTPAIGLNPLTVTFADNSTGTITNRFWSFGDGRTSNTTATVISHTYTNAATLTVSLTVTGPVGSNTFTQTDYITVTNTPPQLLVTPASLNFNPVVIGQTNVLNFQAINLGGDPLSGSVATAPPFSITSGATLNLAAGQTGLVAVSFAPASEGSASNVVVFTSNGGTATNPVTGIGLTPAQLEVSPASIQFGTVAVGSNVQSSFALTNHGTANLSNITVTVGGPFSVLSPPTPFHLPGLSSTNVLIRFAPVSAGSFSNAIVFASANDGRSTNSVLGIGAVVPVANFSGSPLSGVRPLTVTFTDTSTGTITNRFWDFGDGQTTNTTATSLAYTYTSAGTNTVSLLVSGPVGTDDLIRSNYIVATNPPPLLVVSPTNFNFGQLTIGDSLTNHFTITNAGAQTATGMVLTAGPFTVTTNAVFSLAPGQAALVGIAFNPTNAGSFSNLVVFLSNGGNRTNSVVGTSVTPAELAVSPATLNFGNVTIGSFVNANLVATNRGGAALTNATLSIDGGPFVVLSGAPFNLPGFGSTNVLIRFTPISTGAFSNLAVFASSGGDFTNILTGVGLTPSQLGVAPSSLNFGFVTVGSNVQANFVVTNHGGQTLSNTTATVSGGPFSIVSGAAFNLPGFGTTNVVVNFAPASATTFSNAVRFSSSNGGSSTNPVLGTGATVPVANFTGSPTNGLKPLLVNFTDTSTGTITNRFWDFGDGFTTNTTATTVAHSYDDASTNTVSLTVFGPVGSNTRVRSQYIVATNLPPVLVATPTNLIFGPLVVGNTNVLPFQLVNAGGLMLTGSVATTPPFFIAGDPGFSVAPGQTGLVAVGFAPTNATDFTNLVVFTSNGGNRTNTATGSGLTPGELAVNPALLDFGVVLVGTNLEASFVVTNGGGAAISNIAASAIAEPFSILTGIPFDLPGFSSTNVVIRFLPTSEGAFSNVVLFTTENNGNSVNGIFGRAAFVPVASFVGAPTSGFAPLQVQFTDASTGTITNRFWEFGDGFTTNTTQANVTHDYAAGTNTVRLTVSGPLGVHTLARTNYVQVENAPPLLSLNPTNLDFGPVIIGQTKTQSVNIVNAGGLVLTGSVTTTFPFAIPTSSLFVIDPGQTSTVLVTFAPTNAGSATNVLVFASNGGTSTNPVAGLGLTPALLSVSPAGIDFGAVAVGSITQANLLLTNSGGAAITNGAAFLNGGPFSIISGSPFTLPGFGSTNLVLRFSPSSVSTFSNQLFFTTENGTNPIVSVEGFGAIPPDAQFTGNPVRGVRPLSVTFIDDSTGTITNRFWDFGDGTTSNTTSASVLYTYNTAGTNTVSLTVSGPVGVDSLVRSQYIAVTNPPPLLFSSPSALAFSTLIISQSSTQSFEIWNAGGQPLSGTVTATPPFSIPSGNPYNLAPGQTGIVAVSFTPTSAGSFSNVVRFTSNGGNRTNSVTGSALTQPQLTVTPSTINFGIVAVGSNAQASFTVTNSGGAPLTNGVASVSGPFSIISGSPFNLDGFSSTNIVVRFTPAAAGTFSNSVLFTTANAGNRTNLVSGTGAVVPAANFTGAPTIGLRPLTVVFTDTSTGTITNRSWSFGDGSTSNTTASSVQYTYNTAGTNTVVLTVTGPVGTNALSRANYIAVTNPPPQLLSSPAGLAFGTLVIGQSSTQSFQIWNAGGLPLNGTAAASPPFSIQSGNPYNLAPGQTGTVAVSFTPSSAGSFSNAVLFTSNGGNRTNSVTGSALTPAQLAVLPASINFGTVAVGSNAQAIFTVTNSGGATLTNGLASVSGPFSIISGSPFTVPGFGSSNVVVRFTPSAAGTFSNAVVFTSGNGGAGTNAVAGTGAGIPVASFTGTPTSGLRPLTVTFTDNSTGTITNRFWNFGDGSTSNTTASSVQYTYNAAGTNTVVLTVTGPVGTNALSRANYIAVTNLPPQLLSSPTGLAFGTLILGQSSTQSFQIWNAGGLPLSGTVAAAPPFSIESGNPYNLAPGQTGTVAVSFTPSSAGTFSNAVLFTSNGGNRTNAVTGLALTPAQLAVLPDSINFGTIAVGSIADTSFIVTNAGGAPLSNGFASVASGPFSILSPSPFNLPGFGSTNIVIRFTPPAEGAFSNAVIFTSGNDGSSTNAVIGNGAVIPSASFTGTPASGLRPLTVTFTDNSTGTISSRFWDFGDGSTSNTTASSVLHTYNAVGTYTVGLTVNGPVGSGSLVRPDYIAVTNLPPQLLSSPASLAFGILILGQSSTQTFSIWNGGELPLSGTVAASPPFSIQSGNPYSLAPGQTGTVAVSFTPSSAGSFSNAVLFTSNGGNRTNSVTGSALTPAQLAVLPGSINFGTIAVGSLADASFTVTNTGGATLSNGLASVSGPFSVISGSPFTLAGFGSTNVVVRFTPGSAGTFSNAVVFTSGNDGSSTNAVIGTGAIVPIASFTGTPTSGLRPLTVTFTDNSTGTITNRFWTFGDGSTSNTTASSVQYTYNAAGTNTVVLTVTGPVGTNSLSRPNYIAVTNLPPQLLSSPGGLAFGTLILGQSSTQSFQIWNGGGLPLSGTVAAAPPFSIESGNPYNLAPGQTGTVAVSFTPSSAGSFSNAVLFTSNGGNRTNSVTGSALTPAQLLALPASINFGTVAVGAVADASFTVTNTGGATLTNGLASVSGPFSVISGSPFTLAGFSSTNVVVRFTPGAAGTFSNAVVFTSGNDGSSTNAVIGTGAIVPIASFTGTPTSGLRPLTVTFTDNSTGTITNRFWNFGDGSTSNTTASSVQYTYNAAGTNTVVLTVTGPVGTNALSRPNYIAVTNLPPQLLSSPAGLAFGTLIIGQSSTQSFQIWNAGGLPLSGTVAASPPFSIQSGNPYNLAPGQTGTVAVSFTPSSAGSFSNAVLFTSNGGNRTNSVTGSALTPAQLLVLPASINFGTVAVGAVADASFTVTNTGGATLTNGLASAVSGPFSVISGSPFTLAGFGSTNVVVRFTPGSAGTFSNAVVFTSGNDGSSTNAVIGTGAIVPIASFTGTPTSGLRPLTVTFTDNSTGTITNRFWNFGDGSTSNTTASSVQYTYNAAGTNTVALTVTGPVGTNSLSRPNYIAVTNLPPQLLSSPAGLAFGTLILGQSSTQSFQIWNAGGLPLSGTVAASPPFSIPSGNPYNLAPGQTGTVAVSFTPSSAGSFSNAVLFTSNGGNRTNSVTGSALTPAQLLVLPASINFGTVAVGAVADASFTVTNTGGAMLTNGLASVSGPFSIVSGSPFTLAGFGSTNVVVRFTPNTAGTSSNAVVFTSGNDGSSTNAVIGTGAVIPIASFTGTPTSGLRPLTVTFTDNSIGTITNRLWDFGDGDTTNSTATTVSHTYLEASTNTVTLTALGPVGVHADARPNYIVVTNPPPLLVTITTGLDFGNLLVGQVATLSLEIANLGGLPLVGTVTTTLPFLVLDPAVLLLPGQTGHVDITFSPLVPGSYTNLVVVSTTGGNSTNILVGTALRPAQIAVSPLSLNYGTLVVNSNAQASFTVTNLGQVTLSNGIAAVGSGPFTVLSGSPFNLPPSSSTNVVVRFAPTNPGSFSNAVAFTTANGGSSTNAVVGAALTPAQMGVIPAAIGFGTIAVGANAQTAFTVTNLGGTPLSNGVAIINGGPFTVLSGSPFNLPGFGSTNVIVQFAPGAAGSFSNLITFSSANGGGSTNVLAGVGAVVPAAAFTASPTSGLRPLPVTFNDGSTGTITNRFWDFGDGATTNTSASSVNHTYLTAGTHSVTLRVTGPVGSNELTRAAYIQVTNLPPQLLVTPSSLDFGILMVGQTNTQTFQIINGGEQTLVGTASSAGLFQVQSGSPYAIAPGQTGLVAVTFVPQADGTVNGAVLFVSNGGSSTNAVSGTGLTPGQLAVSPASIHFGVVPLGTNAVASFTVTNLGGEYLSNGVATVGGRFAIVSGAAFDLPGFGSTNVVVRFMPNNVANYSNVVIISSANGGSAINPVTGSGAIRPLANFAAGTTLGAKPLMVTFSDSSQGTITNRLWDFGDGTTTNTSATSVAHLYDEFGTNTVTLTVQGPAGSHTMVRPNYIAVTDQLLITSLQLAGPDSVVDFTSQPGKFYRVEYCDNLAGNWSAAVPFVAGTGQIVESIHAGGGGKPRRFYRIKLLSNLDVLPLAAFTANPTTGQVALTVTFVDQSSGWVTNRFWDFGDGTTTNTTASTVTHTYTTGGKRTVSLLVSGPLGASSQTKPDYIEVTDGLRITDLRFSANNVLVSFTSEAGKYYRLEYGNGLPGAPWQTAVDFVPGTGSIVQVADVGAAGKPQRFYRVKVLAGSELVPVAGFTGTPTSGLAPLQVTFTDTSTGHITNRVWVFGDGTSTNTTAKTVTHTYLTAGAHNVSLLAIGPLGVNSTTRTNYIVVSTPSNLLRITSLQFSNSNVLVNFTSEPDNFYRVEYCDGIGTSWLTAVDGVPGTGAIVQATHLGGAGRGVRLYRVKLLGNADLIPAASFQASPTNGPVPLLVTFVDTSSGMITNRFWSFGDGTTTNTTSSLVSHLYTSTGSKTVSLMVSGPLGANSQTRTNYIQVGAPLRISSIQVSGANVLVSFNSQAGKNYRLEFTSQLSSGAVWSTATEPVVGTGGMVQAAHLNGAGQAYRFYRIRELP